MHEDWVPVQIPENLDEMLMAWSDSPEESVGFCLLCGHSIRTESNLIAGTSTHNCEAGRALEAKINAQIQGRIETDDSATD
jgi:hypothetical protein